MISIWSPETISRLAALRVDIERDDRAVAPRGALHIINTVEALLANSSEMGDQVVFRRHAELAIPRTPFIVPYPLGFLQYRPPDGGAGLP
jgi:toxin ParE1/3/4